MRTPISGYKKQGFLLLIVVVAVVLRVAMQVVAPGAAFLPFVILIPAFFYVLSLPVKSDPKANPAKKKGRWGTNIKDWW